MTPDVSYDVYYSVGMRDTIGTEIITRLALQSRFGDKPLEFRVMCPQNGTAVLKGGQEWDEEKNKQNKPKKNTRRAAKLTRLSDSSSVISCKNPELPPQFAACCLLTSIPVTFQ